MASTTPVQEEKLLFFGPEGTFSPAPVTPERRPAEALRLFQGFLCNSDGERAELSNVIMLWEQIPKFSGDFLNNSSGIVPNDHQIDFNIGGKEAKVTLFPGTFYPKTKNAKPQRRFPGVKEQAVEQALIHHACAQAEAHSDNGEVSYYVKFSIRDLARILKSMGSTLSHGQIREALEVLSSSIMTIGSNNDKRDQREAILPGFERNKEQADVAIGSDVWSVKLHPLIAHAIQNVTYRQFPMGITKGYTPPGAYLIRLMHYLVPNISSQLPFTFRLLDLKRLTAGLSHVKLNGSLQAICKELDKMKVDGLLEDYKVEELYPTRRPRGRPSIIDAEFTLYPGKEWIKQVMAGSKRMAASEQSLGLPRSQRKDRQMTLPNM
ncbi:hypothetical protein [Pseudomonas sp. GXZC]|uniref:hypothetical protein n=1 Tax=Pseudomonas sp. GXZC TaxID=3003351 RepID=UPI0022AAD19D|nr:hypothetical protein [Pseudomonas sp. GXZC]WAT32116.1 hypothetical protein OZ428_34205 [Pseudomonas sp. GXZC]